MKLTVENLGPIQEASDVEVSPMTIFVGPSNTGKSYLAMLIYSIFKTLMEDKYFRGRYWYEKDEASKEAFNNLTKSRSAAFVQIDKYFSEWAKTICPGWKNQFIYCFGEEGKNMIEAAENDKNFSVRISGSENQLVLDLTSPENSQLSDRKKEDLYQVLLEKKHAYEKLINDGEETIFRSTPGYVQKIHEQFHVFLSNGENGTESLVVPYYLPATRGGIMQSHRTLVGALIERAPMAGLSNLSPIPLFSGVLSDFMQKLLDIESGRRRRPITMGRRVSVQASSKDASTRMGKISRDIEKRILSGEIHVRRSEVHYPDFRYRFNTNGKKHDVPLMSASSMVSELAPISLFIRHYLHPGDLFIVEEPEAHLHPAAQREISDVLVQLVNSGISVLITTHSDNILEQTGNFIYASDLPGSNGTRLKEEKCSVYLFNKPGKGKIKKTVVKKVPFDPETGLLTEDHLEVSSALYNETVTLMEQGSNPNG